MTATITEVREAAAAVLGALVGIDGKTVTGYPYPPATVETPAAVVAVGEGQFLTYRSSQTSRDLDLIIAILVQRGDLESMERQLDAFLSDSGAQSVYAAFDADPTLDGLIDSVAVVSASGYGTVVYNGVEYQGFTLGVEVLF
jgi:hypothetical protein